MATGRRPWLADLGLDAAGVAVENGRITVDAHSCTSVPHIHAVGDVTDRVNLTPVAIDEGRAFADSVFGSRQRAGEPRSGGQCRVQRSRAGDRWFVGGAGHRTPWSGWCCCASRPLPVNGTGVTSLGPRCLLKLVVEKQTERVLGCHMVGEHAAEIIQMAAIAVGMGATKADFDRTMALHPSVSEEFVTM